MIQEKIDQYIDELTGARNRKFLSTFSDFEIRRAQRYRTNFSIILFDIDNFKEINDLYGHLEGDKVLKELSQFVMSSLRESDILIRYGGDEFIIYLPNTGFEDAKYVAEKILNSVNSQKIAGRNISLSMGVAEYPRDGKTWQELFNKADIALYRAKRRGKGRIAWVEEVEAVPIIPTSQFVDRIEEKRTLINLVNQDQKLVIVRGGAGIGKTRLVKDTLKRIEGVYYFMGVAYGALSEVPFSLLKDLVKYCYDNYKIETKEALASFDQFEMRAFYSIFPEAGESFNVKDIDKYKLYDSILKFFKHFAVHKKVLIYIDDLQWADRSSMELLYYVIRNSPADVKFFATFRTEDHSHDYVENFVSQALRERFIFVLDLKPFEYSAASEFISAILQEEADEEVVRFLYTKSGGNPFFIEELIKELYEKGNLLYDGKRWILKEVEKISVPQSIQHIMRKRVQELEGDKVLEVASCIGHEFSPSIIEGVLEMDMGEIYDSIEKAIKKGILEESGPDTFAFKEDIIRELILQNISQSKRRFYHQKIARWIEQHKGSIANAEELITYHAYRGGDVEKILQYAPIVAKRAMSQFAYEEAKKFWLYYFEYEKDGQKYVKGALDFAECLMIKGELRYAKEFLEEVRQKFPDLIDAEFYSRLSDVLAEQGLYSEALKYIDKAIELAFPQEAKNKNGLQEGQAAEVPLYKYYIEKGWILIRLGHYEDARVVLEQALINKNHLSKYWEGTLYNVLGVLHAEISSPQDAISYYEKAIEIRESINDFKGLGASYIDIAIVYHDLGDMQKAIEYYEKAREIYKQIGYKGGVITAYIDIGMYYLSSRKYEEAMGNFQSAYHEANLIGSKDSMCLALNNIGSVLRLTFKFSEAEVFYRRALEIAKEINSVEHIIMVTRNFVRLYKDGYKDYDKAEEYYKQLEKLLEKKELDTGKFVSLLVGAELYLWKGDLDKAGQILEELRPHLSEKRFQNYKFWFNFALAEYRALRGDRMGAGYALRSAYEEAKARSVKDPDYIVSYFEGLLEFFILTKKKNSALKILDKLEDLYKRYEFLEDLQFLPYLKEEVENIQ
ncbi:MAG: diguanylate cyclase [bacterium]|nr:diguanylate cyclase [bacterium]